MQTELIFETTNHTEIARISELQLWRPPQGTPWFAIPVSMELEFASERLEFQSFDIDVSAKRAVIRLVVDGMDICRGSKFGDQIREPYEALSVQETISNLVETEAISEFKGGFEIRVGWLGAFNAFWRKARRKRKERTESLNSERRVFRVSPSTGNSWVVCEPNSVGKLEGKYMGTRSEGTEEPLCLVSMTKPTGCAEVYLYLDRDNLFFEFFDSRGRREINRNKAVVISELVKRGLSSQTLENQNTPPLSERRDLLFGYGKLTAEPRDD